MNTKLKIDEMILSPSTTINDFVRAGVMDKFTSNFCKQNDFNSLRDILLYHNLIGTFIYCPNIGDQENEQLNEIVRAAEEQVILVSPTASDSVFIRKAYSMAHAVINDITSITDISIIKAKENYEKSYGKQKAMSLIYERLLGDTKVLNKYNDEIKERIKRLGNIGYEGYKLATLMAKLEREISQLECKLLYKE